MRTRGGLVSGMLFVLVVGLSWAPRAHGFGCQASGSLPIFPSTGTTCPDALHLGDLVDILITTTNTSSSTPPGTSVDGEARERLRRRCERRRELHRSPATATSDVCGAAIVYTLACTNTTARRSCPAR